MPSRCYNSDMTDGTKNKRQKYVLTLEEEAKFNGYYGKVLGHPISHDEHTKEVMFIARKIMKQYHQAFKNLVER